MLSQKRYINRELTDESSVSSFYRVNKRIMISTSISHLSVRFFVRVLNTIRCSKMVLCVMQVVLKLRDITLGLDETTATIYSVLLIEYANNEVTRKMMFAGMIGLTTGVIVSLG